MASFVALLCLVAVVAVNAVPYSNEIFEPQTIGLTPGLRSFSNEIPLSDPSIPFHGKTGAEPTEVHIALASPTSVIVHWAVYNYTLAKGSVSSLDPTKYSPVVKYGRRFNLQYTATGSAEVYTQLFSPSGVDGAIAYNYSSPILAHAVITGLKPGTVYSYRVGQLTPTEVFSEKFTFRMPTAAGLEFPQRIIFIADLGTSYNSSATIQHALESLNFGTIAPIVNYIGDFCYADTWYPNGNYTNVPGVSTSFGEEGLGSSTYQPVWDQWLNLFSPIISKAVMHGAIGNHEIEQQTLAPFPIFASVQARFKWDITSKSNGYPGTFFYFSVNVGPSHNIFISPYTDYTPGGVQWQWLYNDMRAINRAVTPFVLVNTHHPWYTSDPFSYKEHEHMRVSMEPITYEFGADVFFYGHVHSYERTAPMNNYAVDPCGAVHITIGDGGNSEGASFFKNNTAYNLVRDGSVNALFFEDTQCPNVTTPLPGYMNPPAGSGVSTFFPWYKRVFTFQADGNSTGSYTTRGYCYAEQPLWSQIREPSFGHGTLDVLSERLALWSWMRNQDGVAVSSDQVYIVRDPVACPNKAGYAPVGTN